METPPPAPTKSYMPWVAVEAALTENRIALEAIYATLPCKVKLVKTPKLLELLSGSRWHDTILTSRLFKLYAAVMFIACADDTGKHRRGDAFIRVMADLKRDQQRAYESLEAEEKAGAEETFMLQYLNCYECAIIKYLHLSKDGGGDDDTIQQCILAMGPETMRQCKFEQLVTTHVVDGASKAVEDAQLEEEELAVKLAEALVFP